jgi:hypothetical protein
MLTTAAALLEARLPLSTAGDVLAKAADVAVQTSTWQTRVAGSLEHFIDVVRDPVISGSGCPYAPTLDETGALRHDYDSDGPRHWPSVVATFPDRAIVSCSDCSKTWAVPFTIGEDADKSSVETGEPEERITAYVTPDELGKTDGDGDEPSEVE